MLLLIGTVLPVFLIFGVYANKEFHNIQKWESVLCQYNANEVFNMSCHMVLPGNFSREDCTLMFEKNTAGCNSEVFPVYGTKQEQFDNFKLNVYRFNDGHNILPAFNFSLTRKQWNVFKIRVKPKDETASCIQFYINKKIQFPKTWTLFYDCPFYDGNVGGQVVELEYTVEYNGVRDTRRYTFIAPNAAQLNPCTKELEKSRTLTYIDTTFSPEIVLYIQLQPSYFKVFEYEVKLCRCIDCKNLNGCLSYSVHNELPNDDHIHLPINLADETGSFFFAIFAKSKICIDGSCYISRTPIFTAPDRSLGIMLTWLVIGFLLLISLSAVSWYLFKKYVKKCYSSGLMNVIDPPKVLLVHHPTHKCHLQVVLHFAQFLKQYCYVDVLLDINDIWKTRHKDPLMWYTEAISSAKFIAIISSPSNNGRSEAIYKNLHTVCLRLISELISNRTNRTEIFNILLPYCKEDDIPPVTKHLKSLALIKDFSKLISYIHRHTKMHSTISKHFLLKKIQSDLKYHGQFLLFSIKEAERLFNNYKNEKKCGQDVLRSTKETQNLLGNDSINENMFAVGTFQDLFNIKKFSSSELDGNKFDDENNKYINFEDYSSIFNIQKLDL